VVVFTGLHPGQADRRVGHGQEQDLVEVRRPLAAEAAGRFGARRVVLEARELWGQEGRDEKGRSEKNTMHEHIWLSWRERFVRARRGRSPV
jgi:hypothetical protein